MSMNNTIEPPVLMNCKQLLVPVNSSKDRIGHIINEVNTGHSSEITNEGLFVLAIASVETMILDILRYYLRWFPEKLDQKTFSISKDDLLYRSRTLVEAEIDRKLNKVSYDSIEKILKYFCNVLSIDHSVFSDDQKEQLREIKATRNLLLHNNLVVNNLYMEKSGPKRRGKEAGDKLAIDTVYLKNTLVLFDTIYDIVIKELSVKYESYTRITAIKNLWQYLFSSPVMVFEDYWVTDSAKDIVVSYKGFTYENSGILANSELMFLGVWRAHFHGISGNLDRFSMYSLDKTHQSKMLFFLSILDDFRLS